MKPSEKFNRESRDAEKRASRRADEERLKAGEDPTYAPGFSAGFGIGFGIGFGGGWDGGGESRPFRRLDLDKASAYGRMGLGSAAA